MEKPDNNYNRYCFSLDIGTKSIVGIIGHIEENVTVIDYSHTEFHDRRVMFDGQIHDIEGVASVAKRVKNKLEEISGLTLENVSVAAAGRSLKTVRCSHKMKLNDQINIDKHTIKLAEINALNEAKNILEGESDENSHYFCVGHSIVEFSLDDSFIKNPLGHKGDSLYIEIIATFLPKIVVEGLNLVMEKTGLTIDYMTLEPIAAIEVSVPENARLLNIAMVDIGAGTSDIAITKNGTICAYAMTSTAGDEITEAISENYLMDFDHAERLKCNLNVSDIQTFEDIVGIKHKIETHEILKSISQSIETVSENIASGILRENQKSPSAVFLVGGSSQIPGLSQKLSQQLDISSERVVIKRVDSIKNLRVSENNDLSGPEHVTPVGILVSALKNRKNDFIEVKINGNNLNLFRTNDLKISDAVLEAHIDPVELMPKKGKSIIILINGKEKKVYGDYGITANIFLNDMPASLDSPIKDADNILIDPAVKGKDAKITLRNLFENDDFVYVNEEKISRIINLKVNDTETDNMSAELNDNDHISYEYLYTIGQLFAYLGYEVSNLKIYNKGDVCRTEDPIFSETYITFEHDSDNKNSDNIETEGYASREASDEYPAENGEEKNNNRYINIICNGNEIQIPQYGNEIIMADILDYVDFDRTKINGRLILEVNGEDANFASVIDDNDEIILKWDNDRQ